MIIVLSISFSSVKTGQSLREKSVSQMHGFLSLSWNKLSCFLSLNGIFDLFSALTIPEAVDFVNLFYSLHCYSGVYDSKMPLNSSTEREVSIYE